jgi:hypothetical protein
VTQMSGERRGTETAGHSHTSILMLGVAAALPVAGSAASGVEALVDYL